MNEPTAELSVFDHEESNQKHCVHTRKSHCSCPRIPMHWPLDFWGEVRKRDKCLNARPITGSGHSRSLVRFLFFFVGSRASKPTRSFSSTHTHTSNESRPFGCMRDLFQRVCMWSINRSRRHFSLALVWWKKRTFIEEKKYVWPSERFVLGKSRSGCACIFVYPFSLAPFFPKLKEGGNVIMSYALQYPLFSTYEPRNRLLFLLQSTAVQFSPEQCHIPTIHVGKNNRLVGWAEKLREAF